MQHCPVDRVSPELVGGHGDVADGNAHAQNLKQAAKLGIAFLVDLDHYKADGYSDSASVANSAKHTKHSSRFAEVVGPARKACRIVEVGDMPCTATAWVKQAHRTFGSESTQHYADIPWKEVQSRRGPATTASLCT